MCDKKVEDMVSIIVPVYKVEAYLDKCVESLIGQTYKNLEIILVNDGSPDNCGRMCDEWGKKDSRVIVVHQENGGISVARNVGIAHSRGEYLLFVDSDDYVDKEYVQAMHERIKVNNADMAMCGFTYVYEDETQKVINIPSNVEIVDRMGAFLGLESSGHQKILYTVVWNKLYKREIWEELCFPEGKICEDEFVMPYVYEKVNTVALIHKSLYAYRKREGSITSAQNERFLQAQLSFYAERENIYKRMATRELLILHQIHLYGVYVMFNVLGNEKRKAVQKKLREYYFAYKYSRKVPVQRKLKDLLAVCSIRLYQKLVNVKNASD